MFRRSVVLAVLTSGAFAAPAGAATLVEANGVLRFTAAAGIQNLLTVSSTGPLTIDTADDPVTWSDAAPLPAGCADADAAPAAPPASVVTCPDKPATFDLGDGSDRAVIEGTEQAATFLGNTGDDVLDANEGTGAQVLDGGPGSDSLAGGSGDDELAGGDGNDNLDAGAGDDQLSGGDGGDVLVLGAGADTVDGGPGADFIDDSSSNGGADTVTGGPGADWVLGSDGGVKDTYDGGAGIDAISYLGSEAYTVDLAAGTAGGSGPADDATGFEDVDGGLHIGTLVTIFSSSAPATLLGSAEANALESGNGDDTIDPRAGNDQVTSRGGDDAIDLRDGFADRASCGAGADTVQADTLDTVADDCETVTRTDAGNANDVPEVPEDRPPAVSIGAPAPAAVLSTTAPNTITATATDDHGVAQVIFSSGERNLCVDTTAPYSCDYRPTAADVGRDTIVAIAVDTAQQTASAVRVVNVPRFEPLSLTAATTPKRDRRAPYRFRTAGRLALPAGVPAATGCKGRVTVTFKAGKKTVSTRRVGLRPDCTYSSRVTFRVPRRLNPKTLSVVVVYGGNEVVLGTRAKRHTVRPR